MKKASLSHLATAAMLMTGCMVPAMVGARGQAGGPTAAGRENWQPKPFTDSSAIAYRKLAVEVGGKDWPTTIAFRCNANWPPVETGIAPRGPVKVFDNLYYLGVPGVGEVTAWAITTSAGIVIIDTLNNSEEARDVIAGGLRKLGLDPRNIKYVLLTHEHLDHFGGSKYLRETFHPRFGMSQAAWDAKVRLRSGSDPTLTMPTRESDDLVLTDGQKLTFGDTVITAVMTPGHTPGATSFIIPVKDNGQLHMAALMGGNRPGTSVEAMHQFRRSLDHFEDFTAPAKVDAGISIQDDTDDMLHRLDVLKARKPGEPNPFVIGREKYIRYDSVWKYCLDANVAEGRTP